jgi:hypothetical protein
MSVGAGPGRTGATTIRDEALRAMRRPDVEIYSKPMIALNHNLLCHLSRLSATAGRCHIYITNGHPAWKRR